MIVKQIEVQLGASRYRVHIADGVLARVGRIMAPVVEGGKAAVVTDDAVGPLYAAAVVESLVEVGFEVVTYTVPAGEASKNWDQAGRIIEWLAASGLDRTDVVVAVGGGVMGDLAGFCAATYLRGIAFVQVPTTLLAQVDSSVGGKTAVDLTAGKNLAGAFKQPRAVIADTSTLNSLPLVEWQSGLGEVVKSAVLDSEEFLAWLERNADSLAGRESGAVAEAVERCVRFKAGVVAADEFEVGPRESLNLGHTLGHAIEKVAGYGVFPHGIAVAEGMRFAARLAERVASVPPEFTARQNAAIDALGLGRVVGEFDADALRSAMGSDKKSRGGKPRFVLATAPGAHVVTTVDESVLAEELEHWTQERGRTT